MSREGLTEEVLFELGIGGCVVTRQVEKQGICSAQETALEEGSWGEWSQEMSQVTGLSAWSRLALTHPTAVMGCAEVSWDQKFCADSVLKWNSDSLEQRPFLLALPVLCLVRPTC